jgi:pimeloyl-ACP methyl ester carboxylesterase
MTLEQQIPSGALIEDVTLAYADGDITLTTTTVRPPPNVSERGIALLTPGFTSSKATFYPILGMLADRGYRAITFSQRGQPGSSGPTDPANYRLDALAGDILELLTSLGLASTPVHLLGHSFGGVVATAAVLAKPEQFASFTLWNSGPKKMDDDFDGILSALREHGPRALWVKDRTDDGLDPDADLNGTLNVIEQYYLTRLMTTAPAQLEAALTILATQEDHTAALASIKARTGLPVLISHGAQDDAWPIDWQRDMAEKLGADYWVVAGAGHSAHADRSYLSASLLATFWDNSL